MLALVDQRLDAIDLLLCGGDLLRRRVVGQRDQDVRQMVLRAVAGLRSQCRIDFGVADADAGLREMLAQALGDQFIAQRVAEIGERLPCCRQLRAHLLGAHLVLLRRCWRSRHRLPRR